MVAAAGEVQESKTKRQCNVTLAILRTVAKSLAIADVEAIESTTVVEHHTKMPSFRYPASPASPGIPGQLLSRLPPAVPPPYTALTCATLQIS